MLFFCPVFCIEDITKKLESDWTEMCDSGMTFSQSIIVAALQGAASICSEKVQREHGTSKTTL